MEKASMHFMTGLALSRSKEQRNIFAAHNVPNAKTRGEDIYRLFSTVEKPVAPLNEPDFNSLKTNFLSLKAKVAKLQTLQLVPNNVIESAQALPKIGDPKLDAEGKLQHRCDIFTEELQSIYASAKVLLKQVNSAKDPSLEFALLSANVKVLISFIKKRFEETQTIAFLIRCHDAAVEEPIKTSSNPLLAEFL